MIRLHATENFILEKEWTQQILQEALIDIDPRGYPAAYGADVRKALSDFHNLPEERLVIVDQDQTQSFVLNPLPCILLVDDDNDSPDVRPYFEAALNNLGYDYDVFDVGGGAGNGPSAAEMAGYNMVLWFSGDKYGGGGSAGPNATDDLNNQRLLRELANTPMEKRTARYVCHAALSDAEGEIRASSKHIAAAGSAAAASEASNSSSIAKAWMNAPGSSTNAVSRATGKPT